MKNIVTLIEATIAGFIVIVIIPGLVVSGLILQTIFGSKFEID